MNRRLHETILRGDVSTFLNLVEEDEHVIHQTVPSSSNTVLHLAARLGHMELASQILKLCPEMASAENEKLETSLHEACREGKVEMVRLLEETDPWIVCKVNKDNQSVLCVACENGRLDVVNYLLNYPWLLTLEQDGFTTSLHLAAASGHTEIVKELMKARPDFAWRKDYNGCTPLHLSSNKGHVGITRELQRLDPDLSSLQDNFGRTPLHVAAMKGRVNIIDEILSMSLESAELTTNDGYTVLHLAVKNNQFEAFKYLTETLVIAKLINTVDNEGNTILHLATAGKLTTTVIYILKLAIDVNALNCNGFTALDVVESDASNSGALAILPALLDAGAKRCDQLPPSSPQIHRAIYKSSKTVRPKKLQESLNQSHRRHFHRKKKIEIQNEGLRNARNTITVVAVLIATVTFAAGVNPPGGFNQVSGKSILGRQTSFKIFAVCNVIALFLSLSIVIVLVSVIPFKRKPMMKLLVVTHKAMWVSTLFMAAAYVAATWAIMPRGHGMTCVLVAMVCIGGGCTLSIFVGLGLLLAKHWVKKWEWRKRKDGSPTCSSTSRIEEMRVMKKHGHESSTNSDIDSSDQSGYHPY